MTQDQFDRFKKVMMEKHRHTLDMYYGNPKEDGLEAIVGTVIADTSMLLDGTISLEDWEKAVAEDKEPMRRVVS